VDEAILDVIVPAFRERHLRVALDSLSAQRDRRFRVLVGDDSSPDGLGKICTEYGDRMSIQHHRFAENLGSTNLVAQWNRCVRLGESPWVWLFSDDDVASPGCVGAIRSALAAGAPLVRLDVRVVGPTGEILDVPPDPPALESRDAFLWQRLKRRRESFAVEYAFSRERWESIGGFVDLPAAWCSDDASWLALAGEDGICHAPGGWVGWRWSGENISASHGRDAEKLEACLRFLESIGPAGWEKLELHMGLAPGVGASAALEWFWFHLAGLGLVIGPLKAGRIEARLVDALGGFARGTRGRLLRKSLRGIKDRLFGRTR